MRTLQILVVTAALLSITACNSSSNVSGWEDTFARDPRIDIDSLSDAERCSLTEADVKESNIDSPTQNVFVDWKEAGVRMSIPWNPQWGTTKYKTAPWRNDGLSGAFGPLELAVGPCDNLLISSYWVGKGPATLLELQKDPTYSGLKAYIIGTKKALRYEQGMLGRDNVKTVAVEVSGGTILFYGYTEADVAMFENVIRTMDTTTLQKL